MHAMPELLVGSVDALPLTAGDAAGDPETAPMLGVPNGVRICGGCGDAGAGSHAPTPPRRLGAFETDADGEFWRDAGRLGYLKTDAHAPGMGRGFWAYYRDYEMLPPEVLEKHNRTRQWTGEDFNSARHAVELDGSTPLANTGRRMPTAAGVE